MQLINKVEIGYFRSIYSIKIDEVKDMNVFFGRNDSGKSNLLRALNLFFNKETNPGAVFDFAQDLSNARKLEASAPSKKKFVFVKVTFNTPPSFRTSLGETFSVKRTWTQSRQSDPKETSSVKSSRYLTRFLNQVRFYYVPAIKDRSIFSRLLGEVYGILAKHDSFGTSLNNFTTEIRKRTSDLTREISGTLKIDSNIATPSDLTALFKALDFDTIGDDEEHYSLILQRGDGVQVRHIPAILAFLSAHGAYEYNIWGFEEPENSLELASAVKEADSFLQYAKKRDIQLFVTSHSPAFFSVREDPVSRFFVDKVKYKDTNSLESKVRKLESGDDTHELMGESMYLPYLSEAMSRMTNQLKTKDEALKDLNRQIDEANRSVLFVEGVSDQIIINAAIRQFFPDGVSFVVAQCEGTTKMEALAKNGKALRVIADRALFVLVDNDKEGRGLSTHRNSCRGGRWIQHNSNKSYWCLLPFQSEFKNAMNSMGLREGCWPNTIENIFSVEFRLQAIQAGKYKVSQKCYDEIREDGAEFAKVTTLFNSTDEAMMYFFPNDKEYKAAFAEYVAQESLADSAVLAPFKDILLGINDIIE